MCPPKQGMKEETQPEHQRDPGSCPRPAQLLTTDALSLSFLIGKVGTVLATSQGYREAS